MWLGCCCRFCWVPCRQPTGVKTKSVPFSSSHSSPEPRGRGGKYHLPIRSQIAFPLLTLRSHTMQHSLAVGWDAASRNCRGNSSLLTVHIPDGVHLPQPKLTTAQMFAHKPCRWGTEGKCQQLDTFCSIDLLSTVGCGCSLHFFFIRGEADGLRVSMKGSWIFSSKIQR